MTQYYPGPYEVELSYVGAGITHKQRLNCVITVEGAVGDPFSNFTVQTRGGASITLNAAVDAYVAVLRNKLSTSTNITTANLYKYEAGTFDKMFLATYDVNVLGSIASAENLNHQTILTFTSSMGNPFRWTVLDDTTNLNTRIPIRDAIASVQAVATYLTGSTNWIIARDGGYPTGKLNSSEGQNEALFKRRNR